MAHIAKYKAPSVGHMLAHYRRDRSSLERDNIDPERIKNDLVVGHYWAFHDLQIINKHRTQ